MIVAKVEITRTTARTIWAMDIPAGLKGGEIQIVYREPVWENLIKIYVFNDHLDTSARVLPTGLVTIPQEECVLNQHLRFGIYGMDADGNTIIPTVMADLGICKPSADPTPDPGLNPDLPVWAQILQAIGQPSELTTQCKTDLVCGINEINTVAGAADEKAQLVLDKANNGDFNGKPGFSPSASVTDTPDGAKITVTDASGTTEQIIHDGKNGKDGKDGITQDISGKQNWATVKLTAFPEAATADTLHAWVNANHKGPDRKWLIESNNPDWTKLVASLGGAPEGANPGDSAFVLLEIPYSEAGPEMLRVQYVLRNSSGVWDMTQYATYATTSPTWHSTGWIKQEEPVGSEVSVQDSTAPVPEEAKIIIYEDETYGPVPRTPEMTQPVGQDEDGHLYTEPGRGSNGVTDHTALTGRDKPDQHPMEAITGLGTTLTRLQDELNKKVSLPSSNGTAGQFAVSDGTGGIMWQDITKWDGGGSY